MLAKPCFHQSMEKNYKKKRSFWWLFETLYFSRVLTYINYHIIIKELFALYLLFNFCQIGFKHCNVFYTYNDVVLIIINNQIFKKLTVIVKVYIVKAQSRLVDCASTGGLGAELLKILRNKQVHLTILVGRMLSIITHGGCWTWTAITTVSFEDLTTYAAVAFHLSYIRTCPVIVLVLGV